MNSSINNFLLSFKRKKLLLACSGGVDSMVLLELLFQFQLDFIVVHVNYHKRGIDSDLDMELVQKECEKRNILCITHHYSAKDHVANFQENARNFRYEIFSQEMKNQDCDLLVLGHHFDDQMETFFMNLTRKSGILGLSGMLQLDGVKIRPLLNSSKVEIYDFARKSKISWREDSSNESYDYTRNRWRNAFLPFLSNELPELESSVSLLIEKFQNEQLRIAENARVVVKYIHENQKLTLDVFCLFSEHELFEIWRQLNQDSTTFDSFCLLPNLQKGKFILGKAPISKIIKEHDYLFFELERMSSILPTIKSVRADSLPKTFSKNELYLDESKLVGELKIRPWKIGDRIQSIGMNGSQLVSDVIKDAKIANHLRGTILVVHDFENIHWVVGLKVGRVSLAEETSKSIVKISIEQKID